MEFKKENLIKSPLNYTGGKFKLLPQILPLFPEKIDTFVDLFGGGFNVGINIKANKIIYNDICYPVSELLSEMKITPLEDQLKIINNYIEKYKLSKENKKGFLDLRSDYNNIKNTNIVPFMLYVLICYSFNNQIRFNSKGEFNLPFGYRNFNLNLKNKYKIFVKELQNKNICFTSVDFKKIDIKSITKVLTEYSFVYADPPYYNSIASYNEKSGWTDKDEKDLLKLLDKLNENNIKFALSNNFKYDNPLLKEWSAKYNINYLKHSYNNCNYHKKDKIGQDIEVLITNY